MKDIQIETNEEIQTLIEQMDGEYYEESIHETKIGYYPFMHLSIMRTSILSWYDFMENSEVLEIGGQFGALTGILCDKCKMVTTIVNTTMEANCIAKRYKKRDNLNIIIGNVQQHINTSKRYDYITLIGSLEIQFNGSKLIEDYSTFLLKLRSLLKPNGKILISLSNRLGVRYFCGEVPPYAEQPFFGINNYPSKNVTGYTFSRKQIEEILHKSGLQSRFYYPLPDYELAQAVYTDDYLPKKNIYERVTTYYKNHNTLTVLEKELYNDIIDNDLFTTLTNSFFIECVGNNDFDKTIYATITSDRGKEYGSVTSILNNNKVRKSALFVEGQKGIKNVYENAKYLEKQKIQIIPHVLYNNKIEMPYIKEPTLMDYLREQYHKNNGLRCVECFDLLYHSILDTSPKKDFDYNSINYQSDYILEKGYIDMVPFNCFYINARLAFFDQEFTIDNCNIKYIMFRALMYTYLSIPEAESVISLESLKERYGLHEQWSSYEIEEENFVSMNRNYKIYNEFYQWARISKSKILKNGRNLIVHE